MADWPAVKVNFRTTVDGVECTASTRYDKVGLAASELADTPEKAEAAARNTLGRKIRQRKSFK
jgi:hypothetical protein